MNAQSDLKEIKDHFDKLTKAIQVKSKDLGDKIVSFNKEKQEFEKIKGKIETVHGPTIKLNVGGTLFETTNSTLSKEKSMLQAMFSGSYKLEKDSQGAYFIDRGPEYFGRILNYLRTGFCKVPEDEDDRQEFLVELEFYQIESLIRLLSERRFEFSHVNDENGYIHWLKKKDSTQIKITTSDGSSGNSNFIEKVGNGWCNNSRNKWFMIEIPQSINPTSYSLSYAGSCCRPYNWKLEVSANNKHFQVLKDHTSCRDLLNCNRANWKLTTNEYFKYFKITCTDHDANSGCFCFHVCHFEIYGKTPPR